MSACAPTPTVEQASQFLSTRVDADGDLSRLLDGVNPYEFDADDDDRLDRDEMEAAFHAALDLDGDGGVDLAELSRHPGELRQLRYGGAWAERRFALIDVNKDGRINRRELRLEERDWKALDDDRDGYVQLAVKLNRWWELRGFVGPDSEWPTRQPVISHLPPVVTVERVLEVFDANADQKISLREMRARPDLFYELDADGNDSVELDELTARVDVIGGRRGRRHRGRLPAPLGPRRQRQGRARGVAARGAHPGRSRGQEPVKLPLPELFDCP